MVHDVNDIRVNGLRLVSAAVNFMSTFSDKSHIQPNNM